MNNISDNLIFPVSLIMLLAGWFYIFKIMPDQVNTLNQIQTPIESSMPIPANTEAPSPTANPTSLIFTVTPTPIATKPSININGGGDGGFEGFDR